MSRYSLQIKNENNKSIDVKSVSILIPNTDTLVSIYEDLDLTRAIDNPLTSANVVFCCSKMFVDISIVLPDGTQIVKNSMQEGDCIIVVDTTVSYNQLTKIDGTNTCFNSVLTKKITIGFAEDSGCDFNFDLPTVTDEYGVTTLERDEYGVLLPATITLTDILPAYCKPLDVTMVSELYRENVVESPMSFQTTVTLGEDALWTDASKISGCSTVTTLAGVSDTAKDLVIVGSPYDTTTWEDIKGNYNARLVINLTYINFSSFNPMPYVATDFCLKFNGINSTALIPANTYLNAGTNDFSMTFYGKDIFTKDNYIMTKRFNNLGLTTGYAMSFQYSATVEASNLLVLENSYEEALGNAATARIPLDTTGLTHIALTKTGTTLKVYVDGVEVTVAGAIRENIDMNTRLTIGRSSKGSYSGYLSGCLDDFRIFTGTILSAEDIAKVMNGEVLGTETLMFKMNEGTGLSITDAVHGIKGSLSDTVQWSVK